MKISRTRHGRAPSSVGEKLFRAALLLILALVAVGLLISSGSLAKSDRQPRQRLSSTPVGASNDPASDSSKKDPNLWGSPKIARVTTTLVPNSRDDVDGDDSDPDLPPFARGRIDEDTYLRLREEPIARLRGLELDKPFDSGARGRAIRQMEGQESRLFEIGQGSSIAPIVGITAAWTALGPAP